MKRNGKVAHGLLALVLPLAVLGLKRATRDRVPETGEAEGETAAEATLRTARKASPFVNMRPYSRCAGSVRLR